MALAVPLGLALGAVLPPLAAPDEGAHLGRVWVLCEGDWRAPGDRADGAPRFPRSIVELHRAVNPPGEIPPRAPRWTPAEWAGVLGRPLEPERRAGLRATGFYTPLAYLPALPGVALGRWLELPAAGLAWLGRATSLLVWVAITCAAIRLCPLRRWTLLVVSTTPTALAAGASVSADAWTNGAALLFVATLAHLAFADTAARASGTMPLGRRELVALLGAALLLGAAKGGYWPLAALVLAIPPARVGGPGRLVALAIAAAAAVLLPTVLWLAAAGGVAPPGVAGTDPAAQLRHVLADPLGFARVVASTAAIETPAWAVSFVGVLGPLTVPLPTAAHLAWSAALAIVLVLDGPAPPALTPARRALFAAAFAACALLAIALAYVGWNPVGASHVLGVQGRYFLPAAPALALALPARARPLPAAAAALSAAGVAACGILAVAAVVARYYAL